MSKPRFALVILLVGVSFFGCSDTPTSAPPPPAARTEEVRFPSDGLMLEGSLHLPASAAPVPAVVIVPGSGPVNRDGTFVPEPGLAPPIYRQWAERFAADTIAVLRYDKRFLTHPVDPLRLSQEDQVHDILAAVTYLESRREIDAHRIVLVGHSEGGNLVPVAASRQPGVEAVVAIAAPAFAVDSLLLMQLRANAAISDSVVNQVAHAFGLLRAGTFPEGGHILGAGEAYWQEWIRYSEKADSIALALGKPMLVVQGLADENFPGAALTANVEHWRSTAEHSALVTLRTYPDVSHILFRGTEPANDVLQDIIAWVRNVAVR